MNPTSSLPSPQTLCPKPDWATTVPNLEAETERYLASGLMPVGWQDDHVVLIDQTLLPHRFNTKIITSAPAMVEAIVTMVVRGAPAIGIAGAYGVVLASQEALSASCVTEKTYKTQVLEACELLQHARPTAVNLAWAIEQMRAAFLEQLSMAHLADGPVLTTDRLEQCHQQLLSLAHWLRVDDLQRCLAIGHHGSQLVPKLGAGLLTHCNAGALATAGFGTALGVIRSAVAADPTIRVFADETRPRLQGASLTAWELVQEKINVTLLTDGMAAWAMKQGKIDMVVVGADRIALNGDSANKIGTYMVALAAKAHNIPFYIAAPLSTIDPQLATGEQIPIEERASEEVALVGGQPICPTSGVSFYNPAFDVTPAELITGIVTERGVALPPYSETLSKWTSLSGSSSLED